MIDPTPTSTDFDFIWLRWLRDLRNKVLHIGGTNQSQSITGSLTVTGDLTITGSLTVTGTVTLSGLPTSDPTNAGELWIDTTASRVIKSSAG